MRKPIFACVSHQVDIHWSGQPQKMDREARKFTFKSTRDSFVFKVFTDSQEPHKLTCGGITPFPATVKLLF